MFKFAEYTMRVESLTKRVSVALSVAGMTFHNGEEDESKIRLVFAGQYSAGKSSILRMLTGRSDIAVGAGITTQQAHKYEWNGIEVIDTPGIHTELRPDHDEISYKAITSADMLVFVVTNELFDSHLAAHFRKLAIDKDKAGEMILIVNKMQRTAQGNVPEQQKIIENSLEGVLAPYTAEQLNICYVDAESYLDSVEERRDDPDLADELVERSGYESLISQLDKFVKEKSVSSKLTTAIYRMDQQLDDAIHRLEPKSSDTDIDALEENFLQQRRALTEARERLQQEVRGIFAQAAADIRELGLSSANLLTEGCKKEEVEHELDLAIRKTDEIVEQCQYDAAKTIEKRMLEVGEAIDAIENSEFSKELKARLTGKFEGLPENIKNILNNVGKEMNKTGKVVVSNAYNATSQGGLKLASFSGSKVHDLVLKVGHSIGHKFKPWEAIKITRGVAIGGQALSVLGVGLSIFMQIKADQDEEMVRADLRANRQNVRGQFNTVAGELESFGRQYITNNVKVLLDEPIEVIDNSIHEIRTTRTNRTNSCRELERLQSECHKLISEIHAS